MFYARWALNLCRHKEQQINITLLTILPLCIHTAASEPPRQPFLKLQCVHAALTFKMAALLSSAFEASTLLLEVALEFFCARGASREFARRLVDGSLMTHDVSSECAWTFFPPPLPNHVEFRTIIFRNDANFCPEINFYHLCHTQIFSNPFQLTKTFWFRIFSIFYVLLRKLYASQDQLKLYTCGNSVNNVAPYLQHLIYGCVVYFISMI